MADEIKADLNPEYDDDGNPIIVAPDKAESEADTKNDNDDKADEDVFNDTIDENNPPPIPVRQSVAQHIIARKNDKIAKLESKLLGEDDAPTLEDDADDGLLTPEANEAIDSKVKKVLAPLLGKMASDADNAEFEALIKAEPEAAKYANHIKAYMAHEAYKGVPPTFIYRSLAFENAKAIGAKKRNTADLEAKQNKGGGRNLIDKENLSNLPTPEDIENMSESDFAQMQEDAIRGKFLS